MNVLAVLVTAFPDGSSLQQPLLPIWRRAEMVERHCASLGGQLSSAASIAEDFPDSTSGGVAIAVLKVATCGAEGIEGGRGGVSRAGTRRGPFPCARPRTGCRPQRWMAALKEATIALRHAPPLRPPPSTQSLWNGSMRSKWRRAFRARQVAWRGSRLHSAVDEGRCTSAAEGGAR